MLIFILCKILLKYKKVDQSTKNHKYFKTARAKEYHLTNAVFVNYITRLQIN